jgi:hypothetical protein
MIKECKCLRLDGASAEEATCQVVEEVPLSIFINGRHFVTAMTSPQMRKEFVIGHLFSERIVSGSQEIESLEIEGNVARVIVEHPMRAIVPRRPIVSGCGGIASFLDESKLPEIKSDFRIGKQQAQGAMESISLSETHLATGGVHSVGLFAEMEPICIIEDIGRLCSYPEAGPDLQPDLRGLHGSGILGHGPEVLCGRHSHHRLARGHYQPGHLHCREDGSMHCRFSAGKEAQRVH